MAYERGTKTSKNEAILIDGLDGFVKSQLDNLSTQMQGRNAELEMGFNKAVLENNLPLEDQLTFRQNQLKQISDDPQERARIRGEISSLKDRIEQKKFADDYTASLHDFNAGLSSIDSVVKFLNDRLAVTTDETIKGKIQDALNTQLNNQFTIQQNVLKAATDYAKIDKSDSVIDAQITKVSTAKNQALLAGKSDVVANLDLQLQSLTQAKTANAIEKTVKNFAVSTATGYQSATGLLDQYNSQISGADSTGPVTIGGVTYNSAKEFWTYKRDSYLSDQSANGFFGQLNQEIKNDQAVKKSNNVLGTSDIAANAQIFSSLSGRPELASYGSLIAATKADALQNGGDLVANKIYQTYQQDYDINKALTSLDALKANGVNVDSTLNNIILKASDIKSTQVQNILNNTQQILKDNPGMDPSAALHQAISTGSGVVLSPNQNVAKSETQIAEESAAAAKAANVPNDPRTTATAPTPSAPTNVPAVNPANGTDLTSKYGKVGSAIYRKSDNHQFGSEQEFFQDSGQSTFQGLKFDEAYKPPAPTPVATPTPAPTPAAPAPAPAPAATPPTPAAPAPTKPKYAGNSIVDFLRLSGQDSSFGARQKMAAANGIQGYTGSADQNLKLLGILNK